METYPTLLLIDRALGDPPRPFSTADDRAALERHARKLVSDYWSDTAWLTGMVSTSALHRVRDDLERRRAALEQARQIQAGVDLIVIGPVVETKILEPHRLTQS